MAKLYCRRPREDQGHMQHNSGSAPAAPVDQGAAGEPVIDFRTQPDRYRHWRLEIDGEVAHLVLDVDEQAPILGGYELKLNSYDLGVDIELHDAVQRLRFEHPEVRVVVIRSGKERAFCAGANIRMLAKASHRHKVHFCKFTNETRLAIEDASQHSGQKYLCAVNGPCAGGGYELALACDRILLVDDRSSAVSLPEVPLLGVLPGTGGLTRVVDKRGVRRDLADVFCTLEEGLRGRKAVAWRLVDEAVPPSRFEARVAEVARELAATSDRPHDARGIPLTPLEREEEPDGLRYPNLDVRFERTARRVHLRIHGPADGDFSLERLEQEGAAFWPLALARELDDAILHLRFNEPELGLVVIESAGDPAAVLACDRFLEAERHHWAVREIRHYLKRVFKRFDVTSRSFITLITPGSCFAGTLAELVLLADRSLMLEGTFEGDNRPPATLTLSPLNFGAYPTANGLARLETRFLYDPEALARVRAACGQPLEAEEAAELGLVTLTFDDIDWEDEVRIMLEERAAFSPDALTGLEANLRFPGPETLESKIFARLSAWQNWIFQRPNATGPEGALRRYGTGLRPSFDHQRV